MLSAKLFATLAILQLGLALLESRTSHQLIDVYFHATYFVVAKSHMYIFLALASACFAVTYFAAFRWVLHPLNNSLSLTHFVMATLGFVLLSVWLSALRSVLASANDLPTVRAYWPVLALLAGALCFLFGCATLAVNCAWTAITVFRSHERLKCRVV
jgi:heme/copper-type cytochrome/quinol oxidase subunit 1